MIFPSDEIEAARQAVYAVMPPTLAVLTLLQIKSERLDLAVLPLDGVPATAQTLANKTYPFPMRICMVVANEAAPPVAQFIAHLRSIAGQSLIESFGATLAE